MNFNMSMNHPMVQSQYFGKMVEALKELWRTQQQEMEQLNIGSKQDFKHHNDLPLARIKRIMKSDEDVRMISAEAPILFAKACELFILELTVRSWTFSEFNSRTGLEKEDVFQVLQSTDIFDFLAEVIINQPDRVGSSASMSVPAPAPPPARRSGAATRQIKSEKTGTRSSSKR
uniref:Transcription factor CBF/NF-Y/archaeal histone domain-containing protein n=1 Tax=Mucochytrium quahogii TaxID=96639 RepID=A0A7S2RTD1_9STRA|mmetsp:Transcript_1055/g.1703  ORF Transcript_1055/g.1703 Transcript_1055/m.1703 type:complete len:174 (+) Transcript_1055:224-745(+)|eukprot:CAMPEP_0203753938 /NCGR_PEP_ID=MMETSP0098-20131031/7627_1 /ASSEMBLY_ACC=CAM_ASM_000208 /TAXON_ID=96639 /ORGANISM=" , Strain NY0313808BC1" /LENGTH=173 /DNA_ID=CAMNT_0050644759 /DNA_START=185 /DNA_END=706 /DNA_ORIENTATION=+